MKNWYPFNIRGKAVIFRFTRLGRLPPALSAAEIMHANGIETLVIEYGNLEEPKRTVSGSPPRLRWATPLAMYIPKFTRPSYILFYTVLRMLKTVKREGKPRFTVSHGIQENVICWVLFKIFRIPYVVHVHEIFDSHEMKGILNKILVKLEGLVLSNAHFLIFPEEERKNIYVNRFKLTCKTYTVPNCPRKFEKTKALDLRNILNLPDHAVLMAYLGGIGHDNMILEGIKAMVEIPALYFLLWGWGDKKYINKIKALRKDLVLEKRVLLLGELIENKWETLSGVDLSYCIYRQDLLRMRYGATASNKLFESMACGIATLVPPSFQFVSQNQVGLLAPSLDAPGIEHALKELVTNPTMRKSYGETGRKIFEQTFHYEKQFQVALEAFKMLYFDKDSVRVAAA